MGQLANLAVMKDAQIIPSWEESASSMGQLAKLAAMKDVPT
eukprot:CAMPEP_0201970682 /NCGR_PEP_ID=MMETSP0904-20121228/33210_1 /ASSEMBLY_ACC=CAM_ASM_000553 /TAXON_ID=420261 /ORGANISM="Thalassiosira antarctica, Strain CCMP982" /LENGTH=40 /DNA_ID= /DNA_START= /DNA_END= /DNA_ORIENTATION=